MGEIILEVKNLKTTFFTDAGEIRAVNSVSFSLESGKVLGIVGESGSGKSVTAYSILQILTWPGRIVGGSVYFRGRNLTELSHREMQKIRGEKISIIFQDPMTSLNPVFTVGNQISEAIRLHTGRRGKSAHARALELLELVGINDPQRRIRQYPHELSGGMQQRVMIAMALACEPDILIADEPTTALDVTIQAQIMELISALQEKLGMAVIMITHDLGVIADMCDDIIVMYAGSVCERGTADDIFYNPKHEYTKGLLRSIPTLEKSDALLTPISGSPVDLLNMPAGTEGMTEPAPSGTEGDVPPPADKVAAFDWTGFDKLINDVRVNTDLKNREAQMHQAEDMLMETGAICPIYYYNDVFMMKPAVEGFYANLFGFKYFMFARNGDSKTLRLCIASEPDKLDPALNTTVDGAVLCVNSFAGLMTHNDKGEKVPDLAEKVDVSEDNLVYTFTLRDGLKWSDGEPLNAKDFEYSWKRCAAEETAADYDYMLSVVKGYPDNLAVKASEDGKTLTVELSAPCPYFYDLCAFPSLFPVPQKAVESAKGYKDANGKLENPGAWALEAGFPSNGPYRLVEWKHKESMVYEKNPNYHRADEVKIERLEFMLSADDAVIFNAYKNGSLDFIDSVPVDEIKGLMSSKNPEFHVVDNIGTYFVIFNVKSPMFAGKTVQQARDMRHALSFMIDRQYIIDTVAQTGQKIATTFIPNGMYDGQGGTDPFKRNDSDYTYPNPDVVGYFPEESDLAKAKELLMSAGFKFDGDKLSAGTPLHIKYITNKGDAHAAIAECMQSDFAQFGITMEISQMDWKTVMAERRAGNYDVARHGWLADFNDPINMLEMWMSDSGNNDAHFGRFE